MYFKSWIFDSYDLSADSLNFGFSSLGCKTYQFSELSDCSRLFVSMDSTDQILETRP